VDKFISNYKKLVGLLIILPVLFLSTPVRAGVESYVLENGMEVILKENHASPMISSTVFVKSGSKYESRFENGITHFLEHLLFDGTSHFSRLELDNGIRDLGGYINAFTRKELTAYFVLMPHQFIEYGMATQADMLFNSVFPIDELAKERQVVIEEINQSADEPDALAERFFMERAYGNTPYARPVLGYRPFIENIPREAIINYWKENYIPENMTLLVIGDFVPDSMKAVIRTVFGSVVTGQTDAPDSVGVVGLTHRQLLTKEKDYSYDIDGQARYDTVARVTSSHIDFSITAPLISDSNYYAFDLLSQYLAMDEVSPLTKALKKTGNPLVSEISVNLVTQEEFSRLEISLLTDQPENSDTVIATVEKVLKGVSGYSADPETLEGIKVQNRCDDIYYSEKLHFYSFIIAPRLMSGGWKFIENYSDNLEKVSWDDCQKAADRWLKEPQYVVTVVKPVEDSGNPAYQPEIVNAGEVVTYFDSVSFPSYDLSRGVVLEFPVTDSVSFELVDRAEYHEEVLANGLTVIIKSSQDSRVFAMNILGKNRSANEDNGKTGITDFVNRCIEKGTVTRNARELSRDLAKIGANVTLYDNPWIPFDDFYTTRRFSFMKFETIDDFAERGFYLFSEMLLYPVFDSATVADVRRDMVGLHRRAGASSSKTARQLFYENLFHGQSFGKPVTGTVETINTITRYDLLEHHAGFYSPENMIISIVTSHSISQVMAWVDRYFGQLCSVGFDSREAGEPEPILASYKVHREMEKKQVNIYLGGLLPGADSDDYTTLVMATRILSDRLYLSLRERQGLAYSVGANSLFDKDFGWYYCSMGTSSENYGKALDGILLEIEKLTLDGPTLAEIRKARNQIWGKLMRAKLSRINQAYYLGMDTYLGRGIRHDSQFLENLRTVTVNDIRRVCSLYFRTDAFVLASAGTKSENDR